MEIKKISFAIIIGLLLFTTACKKDDPQELVPQGNENVEKANKLLEGYIVLSTHAKMSSISKTLLPDGCPTKFKFQWDKEKNKLIVQLPKFQVGNMPFAISYDGETTYSELNTWEKEDYPEAGWVKFKGDDGLVTPYVPEGVEMPEAEGSAVITGYVNPLTEEIEFFINYNMMNVVSHTFRQKIDKSRLKNYEKEFKKYEKDLKKYKEEHGL